MTDATITIEAIDPALVNDMIEDYSKRINSIQHGIDFWARKIDEDNAQIERLEALRDHLALIQEVATKK